jgi:hypothetical protein
MENLTTAQDVMSFNTEVRIYLQNNLQYIREYAEESELLNEIVAHYNTNQELEGNAALDEKQEKQFRYVANEIIENGFFAHA